MGDSGFTRVESATRRRNCAGESRAPTPASAGAMFPEFFSPGTAWHRVQAPASRFTTILRPGNRVSDRLEAHRLTLRAYLRIREQYRNGRGGGVFARQANVSPWFFKGSERTRLPVAAKIALHTAGAIDAWPGSPTPPQNPPEGASTTSTLGISRRRIIR